MLSRMPPKNTLESSRASSSLLWKCLRTFVYAFEPSPRKCEGEGSNEGFSAQYARSNLQSIYHLPLFLLLQHHDTKHDWRRTSPERTDSSSLTRSLPLGKN